MTTSCVETTHSALGSSTANLRRSSFHNSPLRQVARAASASLAFFQQLWTIRRNRRAIAKLQNLDPRLLRDIGLEPGDIQSVLTYGYATDPSLQLEARRQERRLAQRRRAFSRQIRN